MTENIVIEPFQDEPPGGDTLTAYDRAHLKLYIRLLDATADGADWHEIVSILFEIDPEQDPDRAKRIHDNHLARARWMTESGYRELLRESKH